MRRPRFGARRLEQRRGHRCFAVVDVRTGARYATYEGDALLYRYDAEGIAHGMNARSRRLRQQWGTYRRGGPVW